ncbi:MAG: ribonuclease Z [Lachnospiraceae bacterium]|nr:ribonuclease Z [Lachnospiraceae bacterium]
MLDVCLLGTGGMMPLPYRWLTSCMMRYNGSNLLIDSGEGTQIAIRDKGWSVNPIDVILFTHFHADHISGLPGLLLAMANAERKDPVLLVGPKGLERVVTNLRVIAPDLPFELRFHELSGEMEDLEVKDFRIRAFRVRHNVTCYGYRVRIDRNGRFDAARAKELEIPLKYWNPLQKGQTIEDNGRILTPDMVLGAPRKGLQVTYCTDTRPTDSIREAAKGSDLFICEGMYGDEDKISDAKKKKHMMMQEAATLAAEAEVGEMWLTHFSPSVSYPENYAPVINRIFPRTCFVKDGHSADLLFEDEEET